MQKNQFDESAFMAGYILLNVSMGVQVKEPRLSACRTCNKYPKKVLPELRMCCECADKVGMALRSLFGFITQQEKANA